MAIEAEIECVFAAIDDANRLRCAHLAVAQWVHELDKLGRLHMPPRDAALAYQLGRIAAQEVDPALLPALGQAVTRLGTRWLDEGF